MSGTPAIGWALHLHAVPVRNARARIADAAAGGPCTVEVPLAHAPWVTALRRALPIRETRRFALDALGREVLEQVDGRRTVEQLTDAFAARYALTFLEARSLLAQYLRLLMQRGIVAISIPRDAP